MGDETPTGISERVKEYVEVLNQRLPDTVKASVWEDRSEMLRDRIRLLMKNAMLGLILVLILLGLAMDVRLAFWVTMGIPTSILGALLFFPALGLSINMVSLFAVIITVGIVVDDAVIVGENIYHMRREGTDFLTAAIVGARQMAIPVTFSILTNIAAFMPLFFLPGGYRENFPGDPHRRGHDLCDFPGGSPVHPPRPLVQTIKVGGLRMDRRAQQTTGMVWADAHVDSGPYLCAVAGKKCCTSGISPLPVP